MGEASSGLSHGQRDGYRRLQRCRRHARLFLWQVPHVRVRDRRRVQGRRAETARAYAAAERGLPAARDAPPWARVTTCVKTLLPVAKTFGQAHPVGIDDD